MGVEKAMVQRLSTFVCLEHSHRVKSLPFLVLRLHNTPAETIVTIVVFPDPL